MTGTDTRPVLWQLEVSHYNEKVRWALDYKRIPHVRRALLPGLHVAVAQRLTGGECETTPVLTLGGRSIGDSTRDHRGARAALAGAGAVPAPTPTSSSVRSSSRSSSTRSSARTSAARPTTSCCATPTVVRELFAHNQRLPTRALLKVAFPGMVVGMRRALDITPSAAEASRAKMVAAMDRLEQELGGREFLVGNRFSVADLTAAALFYPVVRPAEFPYPSPTEVPPEAETFLRPLAARPGGQWVARTYSRFRRPAPGGRPAPAAA